nr:hypothetical protein CFP56_50385 [Quercus suber]
MQHFTAICRRGASRAHVNGGGVDLQASRHSEDASRSRMCDQGDSVVGEVVEDGAEACSGGLAVGIENCLQYQGALTGHGEG